MPPPNLLLLLPQREQFLAELPSATASCGPAAGAWQAASVSRHGSLLEDGNASDAAHSGCDSEDDAGVYGDAVGGGDGLDVYADFGAGSDDDYEDAAGGASFGTPGGDNAGVAPISLEDAFREKPLTYEDLCRSHIVSLGAFVLVVGE